MHTIIWLAGVGEGGGAREEFENVAHKNNPVFRNYPNKLFHIYIYIYNFYTLLFINFLHVTEPVGIESKQ